VLRTSEKAFDVVLEEIHISVKVIQNQKLGRPIRL